jgi:hypothetical protein
MAQPDADAWRAAMECEKTSLEDMGASEEVDLPPGEWTIGLKLYVPIHVDDGLAITNSFPLYQWFLFILKKKLLIVDLGECSKFLSIIII